MDNVNLWDSLEAYQIKECYELAARFEKSDTARDILRAKSKKIDILHNYVPVQADVPSQKSEMQVLSEVLYELTIEGFTVSRNAGISYSYKLDTLPNSAEKEYILALLSLSNGTSETQRLDALQHIRVALSYSPNDPRYIALATILQEVDI